MPEAPVTLTHAAWRPLEGAGSAPALPRIYRLPFLAPSAPTPVTPAAGAFTVPSDAPGDTLRRVHFVGRAQDHPPKD